MREFSWRYFTLTGDIDAYLLYKRHQVLVEQTEQEDVQPGDSDVDET